MKISLAAIPVGAYPATDSSESISFHQLHADCHARLQQKKWCPTCDRAVPSAEIVKGYEFARDQHVIVTDDELAAVRPPSTRVIDLMQFADAGALDPMVVDRTYYLAPPPDDAAAAAAYAVIREALRGRVGVGKVALYGREYLVAVRPRARVLVLHTLHHAGEVRSVEAIDELGAGAAARVEDVKLARQLIGRFDAPLDLADFSDEYRAGVLGLIRAKIDGDEVVHAAEAPAPAVRELAAALRQSLALMRKRRAAKVVTTARGRRRKGAAGRIELRPGSAV